MPRPSPAVRLFLCLAATVVASTALAEPTAAQEAPEGPDGAEETGPDPAAPDARSDDAPPAEGEPRDAPEVTAPTEPGTTDPGATETGATAPDDTGSDDGSDTAASGDGAADDGSADVEPETGPGASSEGGTSEAPATEPVPRIAVLLLATGDLEQGTADTLSEVLIGAIAARGGVTLIGPVELTAQLGQDDAQMLECVSSQTCLGRVGVQLGLAEVIAGTLAQRGDQWVFNLNRVDVPTGEMAGRVFRDVRGDLGDVADALTTAIPELYRPPTPEPVVPQPPAPLEPARLALTSEAGAEVAIDGAMIGVVGEGPFRHGGITPGRHVVRVSATAMLPWRRVVRLRSGRELSLRADLVDATREAINPVVFIGGAVAVAALGAGIGLGAHSQSNLELTREQRLEGAVTRAEAVAYYRARQNEAIAADILFAVAGSAAVAAVIAIFFPEQHDVEAGPGTLGARF